ncbi:MAG TPA: phage holin family protein [Candidatus Acidoferrum sp.]|nr:phage holin family protein [Candidatus Acidoferrum sp.]
MQAPVETELPRSTRSADLAAEVIHDAQQLVNLEIALAKREIKDLVVANAIALGMVAFGGLLVVLAVLVAIPTLVVILVPWHWQAAAAWVVLYMGIGIGLAVAGRARQVFKLPARTLNSLKENKEWAIRQIRSTVR